MKRKHRLIVIALAGAIVASVLLIYAGWSLFYAEHGSVFRHWMYLFGGQRVAVFDPASFQDPTCRSLAIPSALVGVFTFVVVSWRSGTMARFFSLMVVSAILACLTPRPQYGTSLEYFFVFFWIQAVVTFAIAISFAPMLRFDSGPRYRFAIAELLLLTTITALAITLWPRLKQTVLFYHDSSGQPTGNHWLICLGFVAGANAAIWMLPMASQSTRRLFWIFLALLFSVIAATTLAVGYQECSIFQRPSRPHPPKFPYPFFRGHVYWLVLHGMLQLAFFVMLRSAYGRFGDARFLSRFSRAYGLRINAEPRDATESST